MNGPTLERSHSPAPNVLKYSTKLFTEAETLEDFCNDGDNLKTENSQLVANVLKKLNDSHQAIPQAYSSFLVEICKKFPSCQIFAVHKSEGSSDIERFLPENRKHSRWIPPITVAAN